VFFTPTPGPKLQFLLRYHPRYPSSHTENVPKGHPYYVPFLTDSRRKIAALNYL
jgi:hypothetical protein